MGSGHAGHRVGPRRPVEHKRESLHGLLVPAHELDELGGIGGRGQVHRQVVTADDPAMLLDADVVDAPEALGEYSREHEPDGDGLAMAQVVVAGGLESMAERMAV